MRNEIKQLSSYIDDLDKNVSSLRAILSPVMHMSGTAGVLMQTVKEELDTRSEVSRSIHILSERVKTIISSVDDIAKNLDLGAA